MYLPPTYYNIKQVPTFQLMLVGSLASDPALDPALLPPAMLRFPELLNENKIIFGQSTTSPPPLLTTQFFFSRPCMFVSIFRFLYTTFLDDRNNYDYKN